MKIGDFARKFGLNVSTVRYYVNIGVLLPGMVNGRFDFDASCVRDMERILRYKKFMFSLEEIQLLFFMEKASRFQDEDIVKICGEILKNKKEELTKHKEELSLYVDELDEEIEGLSVLSNDKGEGNGVPFSFIPDLFCPYCQIPLKLDEARIVNNSLERGLLHCDCGYRAKIEDGIIRLQDATDETPFKAFENVESVIAMKDQFSSSYRLLIGKAYLSMYQETSVALEASKHILFGPFTFNFILEYLDKLGKGNTYIVFDPSLKRMEKLKKYLSHSPQKIVFIAGGISQLPLKHGSCDIYIDDYSTVNTLFTYGKYPCDLLAPLIKRGGLVNGIFSTYDQAPLTLANFKKIHPDFPEKMMKLNRLLYEYENVGFSSAKKKKIGITQGSESHDYQGIKGEQIGVWVYSLKKIPKKRI